MIKPSRLADKVHHRIFSHLYRRSLGFFNTCWEDPVVDRLALDIGSDDGILVITSAGCNSLTMIVSCLVNTRPERTGCEPDPPVPSRPEMLGRKRSPGHSSIR